MDCFEEFPALFREELPVFTLQDTYFLSLRGRWLCAKEFFKGLFSLPVRLVKKGSTSCVRVINALLCFGGIILTLGWD